MRQSTATRPPDALDIILVFTFLIGIYLELEFRLGAGVPVPATIAGLAGFCLIIKNGPRIEERHVVTAFLVTFLYTVSLFTASGFEFLFERFKGVIQIAYSLAAGYGLFLALTQFDRQTLAHIFLVFSVVLIVGCALENYTAFRDVSDSFRNAVYSRGVYMSSLRDELLYGQVRPKLFSSEPSAVTFMFTLCSFAWYVLSTFRGKLIVYMGLLAAALFLMRGPTLMLGFALIVPYQIFLASRRFDGSRYYYDVPRMVAATTFSVFVLGVAAVFGAAFYSERLELITSGGDPSFFARVIAPYKTAMRVLAENPVAGAGLAGWEYVEPIVYRIYDTTPTFSGRFRFDTVQSGITNYFWLHWIFLGLFWGIVMIGALSVFFKTLGIPSLMFCWAVWAIFGQASGAYVSPKTWAVVYVLGAAALLHERVSPRQRQMMATEPRPVERRDASWLHARQRMR